MGVLLVLLLLSSGVPAQASTVLSSGRLAVGLNVDGSVVTEDGSLGMLYDPYGESEDAPMGGDMVLPGYPFETWTAEWNGSHQTNGGPHLDDGVSLLWQTPFDTGAVNGVSASGTVGPLDVTIAYDLAWDVDILWIETTVTARNTVSSVRLVRTVDADPDASYASYKTYNLSTGEVVFSEARYAGKAMALAALDGTSGVCDNWCTGSEDVLDGAGVSETDDSVIGVTVDLGDMIAGESVTVWMTYGFGVDGAEAAELALWGLERPDRDGDGLTEAEGDCDDRDPSVYPDAVEWPDGLDNDCDDIIDEGTQLFDDDGDGFTEDQGDCDDDNALVYPGAEPLESVDDANCDGLADDGDWRDDESKPEGWGEDPAPPVELVKGGCSVLGVFGSGPWWVVVWLCAVRRRGVA
jgi:hypothetical protein